MTISRFKSARAIRAALLGTIATAAVATAAFADINTLPDWNGSTFISSFGLPNTATYGQTITGSALNSTLSGFTFELYLPGGDTAPQYQAFVYAWDSVNNRITGPALFTSSVLTGPSAAAFTAVTVNIGTPIHLTNGQQYVIFFTTSSVSQPATNSAYRWGSLTNNTTYNGGQFVFMNNGTDFSQLSSVSWNSIAEDLAMQIFTSPSSLSAILAVDAPINVVNVAAGIDNSVVTLGNTPPSSFTALYSLSGSDLNDALEQLDGEVSADIAESARSAMTPFLSNMLDRFSNRGAGLNGATFASLGGSVVATPTPAAEADILGGHGWITVAGSESHYSGDPLTVGSHNVQAHALGVQGGIDFILSDDAAVGVSVGDTESDFVLNNGLGTSRSNAVQVGAFGTWRPTDNTYVSGAFAYAWHDYDTRRVVTVSGTDVLDASFSAGNYGGRVEGGWRLESDIVGITPYAAVQYQAIDLPSYSETATSGSSAFALSYAARSPSSVRTELGVTLDDDFTGSHDITVHVYDRMAWAHESSSNQATVAAFNALPGSAFTVFGAVPMRDAALLSLGLQASSGAFAVGGQFDAQFGDRSLSYGGRVGVSYKW